MKVTFLLKNKTDYFYKKMDDLDLEEQYQYLRKVMNIRSRVGNFRETVEFNLRRKQGDTFKSRSIEVRRGYRLMSFEL